MELHAKAGSHRDGKRPRRPSRRRSRADRRRAALLMGLVRYLLAAAVITAHCRPYFGTRLLTGGTMSVRLFFIISGFYMALILRERYAGKPVRVFYANRALKLAPVYYVVLGLYAVAALVMSGLLGRPLNMFSDPRQLAELDAPSLAWVGLSHLLVVSHELLFFLDFSGGHPVPAGTVAGAVPGIQLMLNAPVWSLSLEVMFYALAPFLFRLRWAQVAAIGALLLLARCAVLASHPAGENWSTNAFPFELPFFLLGYLSYAMYRGGLVGRLPAWAPKAVSGAFLALLATYQYLTRTEWFLYPLAVLALPFLFHLSKDSRLDQRIGNLSYPIYLVHFLVLSLVGPVLWKIDYRLYADGVAPCTLAVSTLLAVLLDRHVAEPVERLRRRLAA